MVGIIDRDVSSICEKLDFSQIYNKKILVTGASGLIGVYLISCLKFFKEKNNLEIYAWIKNEIDENFIEIFSGCNVIRKDLTDENSFSDLPEFDVILHSAGYGQPAKFMEDKIKTIKLNTISTIKLFENLNPNGKFLFVSSSEIYSGLDRNDISETEIGTTNTDHPRSCYIEGKRCGESICYTYSEKGYDVKIVRLSLAYGPGTKKNDQRVLNSLIQKGLENDIIELLDHGNSIRTYSYITDVIEMFWNIILFGTEKLYNVGGESIVSILNLSELIGEEMGKNVKIPETENKLVGNPNLVNISIRRYLNEFEKKDFVSIKEGLRNTIEWQKKLYKK